MSSTLRAVAAAVVTLLVAGGLFAAGPATAAEDPSMTGAPAAGDCYDLNLGQLRGYDTTEDTVDCAEDHTVVVAGVRKLPQSVDWDEEQKVSRAIGKACYKARWNLSDDKVRLRYYRSQYAVFALAPSQDDRDAGARWFSCLIAITDDRGVVDLPDRLPRLTNNLPDSVARCVTRRYEYTTCADTHLWRSAHAFYVRGKISDRSIDRAASRVCPRHVSSRKWLRSAQDVQGNRFMVQCYTRTSR